MDTRPNHSARRPRTALRDAAHLSGQPLGVAATPAVAVGETSVEPTRRTAKPSQRILARVTVRLRPHGTSTEAEPSGNRLRVSLLLEQIMRVVAACGGTPVYPRAIAQGSGSAKVVLIYSAELEHHEQISRRVREEFERPELVVIAQRNLALVAIRTPREIDIQQQVADCFAKWGCRIVQTMHGHVPASISPEGEAALCFLVSPRLGFDPEQLADRLRTHLSPKPGVRVVVKDPASVFTNRTSDAEAAPPTLPAISQRASHDSDTLVARSVIVDGGKPGLMNQVMGELSNEGARVIARVSYMRDDRKRAVEVMYEAPLKGMLRINASMSRRQADWKVRTQFLGRSHETVALDIDCGSFIEATQNMTELFASRNLLLLETLPTVYPDGDQIRLSLSAVALVITASIQRTGQPR